MKRTLCLVLSLILIASLLAVPASAVNAAYSNTKLFLTTLDNADISYTIVESTEEDDYITIKNGGEQFNYTIHYFFSSDDETINIRVWDIITFADADLGKVLRAVNKLNYDYKWCNFLVDESDNTVTAEWDLVVRPNAKADEIALEATIHLVSMLDIAYEALSIYNK